MPVLKQVFEKYPQQVKIYFKQYPLRNHNYAFKAAQATIAAEAQGKFWEFHDQVFENYNRLNDATIEKIRKKLSLDKAPFQEMMQNPKTTAQINSDIQDGRKAGVRGTPAVFINGVLLRNKNLRGFEQAINDELKKQANEEK